MLRVMSDHHGASEAQTVSLPEPPCSLTVLSLLSLVVGVVAGALCGGFRWCLEQADSVRNAWSLHALHGFPAGLLLVAGGAVMALISAWMVRRLAPLASGSGIPHVEAVLAGMAQPAPFRLVPVKFLGGVLAIGGGLALGREGPSVQMGATAANAIGRFVRLGADDCRSLLAAGAGAGLATAFNAPAAGAIFVLEELVGRFNPRTACSALGASVAAILMARAMLGGAPDFVVPDFPVIPQVLPQFLFLLTGLVTGLLSVVYNRTLLATLRLSERAAMSVEVRAALIGALGGLIVWLAPHVAGGGDWLTQNAINNTLTWQILPLLFVVRLLFGALSYAAATPGGLFAPMLALGALVGLGCGDIAHVLAPGLVHGTMPFVVVGMSAMFTGAVRAPLTGIVLVVEMTNASNLLLPLLAGSFAAMFVADGLKEEPIYTALRNRVSLDER
ncbi:H(+)/Cl(-) exchange transporter ClcA [Acetobacter thailandicus]|nr:H(+)/Cl(-) exchange transporter ClcA [Acetobacter thailandicus]